MILERGEGANSLIIATCQTDVEGVWVQSAQVGNNLITITLNTAAPQTIAIAYFVIG
jgi:hypothetical protein